jgi:Domain of unknown function (DUF397)
MRKQGVPVPAWRKSTYSANGTECVEVTDHLPGFVAVRDSKNAGGQELAFGPAEWKRFVGHLKTPDCRSSGSI